MNACEIVLPPLREGEGDLEPLVHYYLRRFSLDLGKPVHQVVPETMELLRRYTWPGNVRELQNVLSQALLRSTGNILIPTYLPEHIRTTILSRPNPPRATREDDSSTEQLLPLVNFIRERLAGGTKALANEVQILVERVLLPEVLWTPAATR